MKRRRKWELRPRVKQLTTVKCLWGWFTFCFMPTVNNTLIERKHMKKILLISGLLLGQFAIAGMGGYTTTNCASASGRTMVSVYTGDEDMSMTIIVDGKASVNEIGKKGVSFAGNDQVIILKKNNSIQAGLSGNGTKRELRLLADPRKGTDIDYMAKSDEQNIPLTCKSFTKEP